MRCNKLVEHTKLSGFMFRPRGCGGTSVKLNTHVYKEHDFQVPFHAFVNRYTLHLLYAATVVTKKNVTCN
jgi:hypothetical protein